MALKVVDCSRYDNGRRQDQTGSAALDFAKVKAAGVHAVIARWGTGNQRDLFFAQNLHGAQAAGLEVGGYWVPYPGNDQAADARAFISDLAAVCGGMAGVAVMLDVEDYSGGAHITRAEADRAAWTLADRVGRRSGDYFPRWWLQAHHDEGWGTLPTGDLWWDSGYPYGDNPPPPNFAPTSRAAYLGWTPGAWQYTSAGQVPGMSDRTDISAFFGDAADWAAWTGGTADMPITQDDADLIMRTFNIGAQTNHGAQLDGLAARIADMVKARSGGATAAQVQAVATALASNTASVNAGIADAKSAILAYLAALPTAHLSDEDRAALARSIADLLPDLETGEVEAALRHIFADLATPPPAA